MILMCKRCILNVFDVFDVALKKFHVNYANIFWYIQYKNAYWNSNTHAKDNDFIFFDRENVSEATWSKNSKCKMLILGALFSWRQLFVVCSTLPRIYHWINVYWILTLKTYTCRYNK